MPSGKVRHIQLRVNPAEAILLKVPPTDVVNRSNHTLVNKPYQLRTGLHHEIYSHLGNCNGRNTKILAIGSSTTESAFVEEGDRWTDILQKLYDEKNDGEVCVYNFGVGGNHLLHAHTIAFYTIPQLKPKLALIMSNGTDVGHLLRNGDYFKWDLPEKSFYVEYNKNPESIWLIKKILRNIFPATFRIRDDLHLRGGNLREPKVKNLRMDEKSISTYKTIYGQKLSELIKLVRAYGSTPIVILEPRKVLGDSSRHKKIKDHYQFRGVKYEKFLKLHSLFNEVAQKKCETESVICIDATALNNEDMMYDEGHLNTVGSKVFAKLIFEQLRTDYDLLKK